MKPIFFLGLCLVGASVVLAQKAPVEKARYVRPSGEEFVTECRFTICRDDSGWSIQSLTERGNTELSLHARYDKNDSLTAAWVTLTTGDRKQTATVQVTSGKAKIQRDEAMSQEFELPTGIIVTSAPDWSDAFLLARRYDRRHGGKQQFPGLWIHPAQPAQQLMFTMEWLGTDAIEHDGNKLELDRFGIRLRGNSDYMVWADAKGRMVKLTRLPFQDRATSGFVLEGFEKAAMTLRPEAP